METSRSTTDVIVRVNRRLAPQWSARELAAAVRDDLVYVHVELRPASRHPRMQKKHVVMLSGKNLVADLDDQLMALVVKSLAPMVGIGGGLLHDGVCGNHLPRNQVFADAEVLERPLRPGAPEFVGRNSNFAQ
jgi:hypothetical protein